MIVEEVFPSDNGLDNENCSRPRSAILSFACKIPSTMSTVPRDPDDLRVAKPVAILSRDVLNVGIVGTITLLGNSSAMIWFGWGRIDEVALEDNKDESSSAIKSTGTSGLLPMGPFVVAMPRTEYQGAFSAVKASSSKLISHGGTESGIQNETIAGQMAERLAQRLNIAVYVSCNLDETPSLTGCEGTMERHLLRSRAGALAEKEAGRLLEERLQIPTGKALGESHTN